MYDPSPSAGVPPNLIRLAAMRRHVEAHAVSGSPVVAVDRRWGLLGWGLTVCVLLAVFGVLPELLSSASTSVEHHLKARTPVP